MQVGRAAVSAGQPLAAEAAARVLDQGGNAMDAALAGSAVLCVVQPQACSLGGDGFIQVWWDGDWLTLNGSGGAPAAVNDVVYESPRLPRLGPRSIAVPGLMPAWEAAAARFASQGWDRLLAPAIGLAANGFTVDDYLAEAIAGVADSAIGHSLGQLILRQGQPFQAGDLLRQAALAETLEELAAFGPMALHHGAAGRMIASVIQTRGGLLSADDLAIAIDWEPPLRRRYRDVEVGTNPLVSMGCVLLAELGIMEGFEVRHRRFDEAALIDLAVRAKHAAFDEADRVLGDPRTRSVDLERLLGADAIAASQRAVAAQSAVGRSNGGEGSDTTSIVVADAAGHVVVVIQSIFNEWGSREIIPSLGILMNDRLANVPLDPGHPNAAAGGRRPVHTLHTVIAQREGRVIFAGATPGGRGQVQTTLQVLVDLIDLDMPLDAAVAAPRWLSGAAYAGPGDQTLYLDPAFRHGLLGELAARGHVVQPLPSDRIAALGCVTAVGQAAGGWTAVADHRRAAHSIVL